MFQPDDKVDRLLAQDSPDLIAVQRWRERARAAEAKARDEHARGWAEGARAAVDGHTECSRVDCGKPSRHFYINCSYCDEHEPDPTGPAYRS